MSKPKSLRIYAADSPRRPGNDPQPGDNDWLIDMPLSDGRTLYLSIGKRGHDALRDMLAEEAGDDLMGAGWTPTPPTEQAFYWHWNGEEDCAPLPLSVHYSGTCGKCFVASGQFGITHPVDCDEYGGWWRRVVEPAIPVHLIRGR